MGYSYVLSLKDSSVAYVTSPGTQFSAATNFPCSQPKYKRILSVGRYPGKAASRTKQVCWTPFSSLIGSGAENFNQAAWLQHESGTLDPTYPYPYLLKSPAGISRSPQSGMLHSGAPSIAVLSPLKE